MIETGSQGLLGIYNQRELHQTSFLATITTYTTLPSLNAPSQNLEQMLSSEPDGGPTDILLSPWGTWINSRDPYELMFDRLDSQDMVRLGKAGELILFYMEYLPDRGHKFDQMADYSGGFEYEDYDPRDTELYLGRRFEEDDEFGLEYTMPILDDGNHEPPPAMLEDFSSEDPYIPESFSEQKLGDDIASEIKNAILEHIIEATSRVR